MTVKTYRVRLILENHKSVNTEVQADSLSGARQLVLSQNPGARIAAGPHEVR